MQFPLCEFAIPEFHSHRYIAFTYLHRRRYLSQLSQAVPDPPASPSTSSVSIPSQTPRITTETILSAHLMLLILRAPDGIAIMNEIKESLANVVKDRGWMEGTDVGTKVVYLALGKRCLKIDRRGGGGGRVSFAS